MTPLPLSAPATLRNRHPIAEVLKRYLPSQARVLEVASGTGEHALFLAEAVAAKDWWPTDIDPAALASIEAWRQTQDAQAMRDIVHPPQRFDVMAADAAESDVARNLPPLDAVVCINMIHIAPWAATEGLMATAARLLRKGGILYTYGPYRRNDRHTAPSNEAFDESLRQRNPTWGIRGLEAVIGVAARHDLVIDTVVGMPANNFSVVFRSTERPTP